MRRSYLDNGTTHDLTSTFSTSLFISPVLVRRDSSLFRKFEIKGVYDKKFGPTVDNFRPILPNHNSAVVVDHWRVRSLNFADICEYFFQCLWEVVSELR